METRIQKEFVDRGLGFPIRLINVPMAKVRGVWTPRINYNELAQTVLRALSYKQSRLTGNEVKFIRTHFEMTLQEFARRFCVTHVAVLKWEKTENSSTAMNWTMEKDIRLFILSQLDSRPAELAKLYVVLEALPEGRSASLHFDAKKIAA